MLSHCALRMSLGDQPALTSLDRNLVVVLGILGTVYFPASSHPFQKEGCGFVFFHTFLPHIFAAVFEFGLTGSPLSVRRFLQVLRLEVLERFHGR